MDCIRWLIRALDGESATNYRGLYTKMTNFPIFIPQMESGSWDGTRRFQDQNSTSQPIMIWKSHHGLMLQRGKRKYPFKLLNGETHVKGKMPAVQDTARTIGVSHKVSGL